MSSWRLDLTQSSDISTIGNSTVQADRRWLTQVCKNKVLPTGCPVIRRGIPSK